MGKFFQSIFLSGFLATRHESEPNKSATNRYTARARFKLCNIFYFEWNAALCSSANFSFVRPRKQYRTFGGLISKQDSRKLIIMATCKITLGSDVSYIIRVARQGGRAQNRKGRGRVSCYASKQLSISAFPHVKTLNQYVW